MQDTSDEKTYSLNGVDLPHDDQIITPQVAAALKRGNYERPEIQALPKFLTPEDRAIALQKPWMRVLRKVIAPACLFELSAV